MTERLYYQDAYLWTFDGRVVDAAADGTRVFLDRTAFYPSSGGQVHDIGTINGIPVLDVVDEEDRVAHVLARPLSGVEAHGEIDRARRLDHMQQHTGQHLLSAVLHELFGFATVSVHMEETCTVDLDAAAITPEQLEQAEQRCAEIVAEARPVGISFEENTADLGLRKASSRAGTLRIISIEGIDRSACGGTHVRKTSEIGLVLTGKVEKIRGTTRIEFVCGNRALARAREDFRLLQSISRLISSAPANAPAMIEGLQERAKTLEKSVQRLATELAKREGAELFAATEIGGNGLRVARVEGAIDEAMRTRAQAFVAGGKAVFVAIANDPAAVLMAASADAGIDVGQKMKAAVTRVSGRGGGNKALAQGTVPDAALLGQVAAELLG